MVPVLVRTRDKLGLVWGSQGNAAVCLGLQEGPVPHPGMDTVYSQLLHLWHFPAVKIRKLCLLAGKAGPDLSNTRWFVSVTLLFTLIFLAVFWCLLRFEAKSSLSSPFLSCKYPSTHLPTLDHGREGFSWSAQPELRDWYQCSTRGGQEASSPCSSFPYPAV